MRGLTQDEQLLLVVSIMPALADMLEDLPFKGTAKQRANNLINSIRLMDKFFMNDTPNNEVEEQNYIQRKFFDFAVELFKEVPCNTDTDHSTQLEVSK